jgi:beta-mannosidase
MSATRAHRFRGTLHACVGVVALLISTAALGTPPSSQSLDAGWQFRLAPGDANAKDHPQAARWLPATVPASAQTDLLARHLIPDPYLGENEAKVQWVGLSDWQYRTRFNVDEATLRRDHVELVFDGLDTFAEVYVNGRKAISADNMFRRWAAPVKTLLHAGANTLDVTLHSPIKRILPGLLKQPHALPGEFDSAFGDEPKGKQTANYVRKAAYQYGWDWGPRIVTIGIWRPVHLDSWDALRISDFHIAQQHVDADTALLQAQVRIESDRAAKAHLTLRWRAPDGSEQTLQREADLLSGANQLEIPIHIEKPQRWWPAGYGAQNLYDFHVEVVANGTAEASSNQETGLRSIELRRQKDRWGKSFAFVVNGVPVFAKGANLIPPDSFPTRVNPQRWQQLLQSARDANMNMLRVWGGGYYLPDDFYSQADRLGILIWQDFMFGGAIPPPDAAFRENVKQEAIEQVTRLRDHPSIVLWCGNNEVETGWESWDDRKAFEKTISAAERERIEAGMRALFDRTLRDVVATHAPDVPYWPSTPSSDYDGAANLLNDGDYHYWNVWSGDALPASAYLDVTPRFQSEYGLQSMPAMATIESFVGPKDLSIDSTALIAHQKYDRGHENQRLLLYIRREFGEPKDFDSLIYLSQVMQAEGIELAAEHLRASRPHSMGSLYWQLNDVWPGIAWSSIDWYGRWKSLQYHARRFYAPLLIAALRDHGVTTVSLVSDRTTPVQAHWRMRVMDFAGRVLNRRQADMTLPPLSSTQVGKFSDAQLLRGADPSKTFVVFEWLDGDRMISRNLVFFDAAKQLTLPSPHIRTQLEPAKDGYSLTLQTDTLAREVWISFSDPDARISDNAFDLLPGERMTLTVHSRASLDVLRKSLRVQNLADVRQRGAP